jgi:hypothetical protein
MKNSKPLKLLLVISGLIAVGLGAAILIVPVAFYAPYGIVVAGNASLLSELKAPAIALLAGGIFIMSGAFVARHTFAATVVSAFVYLTFGLSRVVSMVMHGMPSDGLVQAAGLELAIGLLGAWALVKYRKAPEPTGAQPLTVGL